ncbi:MULTISPECIES: ImmA/IrrE family metallo-endopeptidase [Leuconostoc]|uniref:ImmA/IrrE family metallo-endopeptidase n=1 Tax=Leuconostoc TaxID=1243 RepID=UPI000B9D7B2E|nr:MULTISPECIES: ImmA/IrrE family metallo-endopeptidase [Leuconostoc]MCT4377423.1 ImmA/IrrE family metallo-endopeptidase [Leuconostoc suionicum]BAX73389.1 putative receptor [Leuconostoc mesenteroides]
MNKTFCYDHVYPDIVNALESKAKNSGTVLVLADDLLSHVPDTALIKNKAIIMNMNFQVNVDYCYRLAHELSHILYGDHDAQAVYQFSEYGKRGEELLAHRNAIKILMKIKEPSNPINFMNYYRIPSWLEKDVIKTFREVTIVD